MENGTDAAVLACRRNLNRLPDSLLSLSHTPICRTPERYLGEVEGLGPDVFRPDYAIAEFHNYLARTPDCKI
jgi:hypothetical protein